MANPLDIGLKIVQLLDSIGIKPGTFLGKASNVKKAFTGGKPTFFKPDVLETLRSQDGNFTDALNLIEEEAKFIANATDAEKMAFLNNLMEYKSLGGPQKTKSGITALDQAKNLTDEAGDLQTSVEDLQGLAKSMKDDAEKSLAQSKKDLDDWVTTGGQPFKKKDNKFLGGSMHEESQLRTGIREFLQTEYKNGRLKLDELDVERIMQYSPMIEHDPILVFKKIYGEDAYTKAGSFPGAFEKGENFKHYEQIFRENMGDEILQIKNNEYKGDGKLVLTEEDEVFKPTPDDDDIPFAAGGLAALLGEETPRNNYYTGGMIDVEPNLSDIGHGSDSLMARTRLVSPNSQATTSTGLNYLLAEDNDNIRVPFGKGKAVYDRNSFEHKINELKAAYKHYKRGSATSGRQGILTFEQFAPLFAKENFAEGGRTGFRVGKSVENKKKKKPSIEDLRKMLFELRMMPNFGEPMNFPYKSIEDIPPEVLEMLRKDPNFDLETFLKKVAWSDSDKTRIQEKLKGRDEPWGVYSPMSDMSFLNYQKFGKSEPIGDGLLSIKSPTDADKVQTILHEMRHQKMKEPWFWESSAVPKYVRDTEDPHYSFQKYGDDDPNKFVGGEELFVRFMDQHFGDVAESGTIAGSDYKPYFDKILKDHWDPYAERYKEILTEEKRVKDKPYGLAEGGIAGLRQGYSKGKGVDFARRGFLKVVGGTVGAIAALKSGALKLLGKSSPKAIPKIVEIGKGSGVPDWFEPMVNKVLADGLDVTKGNAIVDGQVVKRIDTPNGQVDVYHNERTGEIDVEYASESHAALGDSVHLNYKPGWSMADEGNPNPADEFLASENIPEGRASGPDDYDIEMGENTVDEVGGLYSDTSELEKLGGKNINMREILKNIEKKKSLKKMQNEPVDFVTDVQGDYDPT